MKSIAWLGARPRALASIGIVSAAAVTLGFLAFTYEGKPTAKVDLNDGGVWLTNRSSLLVGHFNSESRVLDGGLRTLSEDYDVLQAGDRVLITDPVESSVTAVDPARMVLNESSQIAPGSTVALGAGTVATVDNAGSLRVAPFGAVAALSPEGAEPVDDIGADAVTTVTTGGAVFAASPETGTLYGYVTGPDDTLTRGGERTLEGVEEDHELAITAVGAIAVVLDRTTGELYSSEGLRATVAKDAVLQLPSNATDAVTLATGDAMLRVPLDGGDVVETSNPASGDPAQPAFVAGCAYGAWSGSGGYIRDCAGEASDEVRTIDGISPESVLRFRVNRDVVILNDVYSGAAWLASDSLQRVDNWQDIIPPEGEGEEEEETTEETIQTTLPERTEENTDPVAKDDRYGARPGRTTVLPILENDLDADGDVLVAEVTGEPSTGRIDPIYNGTALQITLPDDAEGRTSFTYEVSDGRGGKDAARVDIEIRPLDVNSPPVQKRKTAVTVETGGTVTSSILSDWIDPDGDDIFLQSVAPDGGDEADFTSDGRVTYRAIGGVPGRKDVPVNVSDGTDSGTGVARYDIRPLGTTVPVTNADHVVTRVDRPVTISPLANDTSSGTETLRLTRVDEVEGARITTDIAAKSFTFSAPKEGTYYVQYLASAGPNSALGIVRVDVLPPGDSDEPPIAVRDVALLRSGGEVLVNVLGNDTDPAGGILVVQSVSAPEGSGIAAAVLGHETIRITDRATLDTQTSVTYTISNGEQSATGEIVVIPVPAPSRLRPPVAVDDEVTVRVGDVATIPVMGNDYHPNDDTIHIAPELIPPLVDPEDGEVFVSEDTLRFRAGDEPGTVNATYEVEDSTGQRDAGYVTIRVLPRNDETNTAPRPRDVTVRTLSGSRVAIPIALDGIDDDGDSVELVGVATSPTKGRIVSTADDSFVYEAFADAVGADEFTYRVRDRLGKEATGAIEVGIAPPAAENQAPYAVRDSIVMRPGREVAVPALVNDSDPDGDEFGFAEDAVDVPDDVPGLAAVVSGEHLIITAPDREMQTSVGYTIVDERGLRASATVQITVDEDVPLMRPVARDDRVSAEDVAEDGAVTIAVLENDDDPDGTRAALTVTLGTGGENATVAADGTIRATVSEERQLITYTVTDEDGLEASAFVHIPAFEELPPTLISTKAVEVKSGETRELKLAEYVRAAGGRDVVITEAAKVSAPNSNGDDLVKDEKTLVYTSADRYFGADALTFEVTDGAGPDDPDGRKATLTIPITVLPPDNQPPEMVGAAMTVAQEEEPSTLDLRELVTDPDPDDRDKLRFEASRDVPAGASVELDGSVLRVAAGSLTKGTTFSVGVSVTDGTNDPVNAAITVTVTASTRELATVVDDVVEQADQGKTITHNVLSNDVSPFRGAPLKIVRTDLETGKVSSVTTDGTNISVTSLPDFVGTIVVRYTVEDKTGDPDRHVDGRLRITVQGRPDAPGRPTVTSVESRTVVLSWTPPIDNGRRITGYTVSSTAGGYSRDCASTTCTLDGLTNDVEYNFVVTATNSVGTSDPSLESETARPDQRPDQPAPPTLDFGDRSLDVRWTTPRTEGSAVESYTLEISPAPPSGITQKTGVTATDLRWEGLENGVAYQVRVRAHNRAPDPSDFSAWSAAMIPAAPPEAPGTPTVARLDPVGSQAQMRVSWNQPAANGDPIAGYELDVLRGGVVVRTVQVPAGQTSQAVVVDTSETDYTYRVRAQNKAGWGGYSPESAPRRAFRAPDAPTGVAATAGNNVVDVTWTAGSLNGARSGEVSWQYRVGSGGWRGDWVGGGSNGSGRIGNGQVNNNGSYTVQVRAVATADGTTYEGAASAASNSVAPYGQIGKPKASASASGQSVTVSWSLPARNGRDVSATVKITGAASEQFTTTGNGSRSFNVGHSKTVKIEVIAKAAGSDNTSDSAQARTADAPPPPQPKVWVTKGSKGPQACANGCYFFVVNTQDFPAGNYRINCHTSSSGKFNNYNGPFSLPANGSRQLECWHGSDNVDVWVDILDWGDGVDTEKRFWAK